MCRSSWHRSGKNARNTGKETHLVDGRVAAWGLVLLGAILAGLMLWSPGWTRPVSATGGQLDKMRSRYPHIVGSRLETCILCHRSGSDRLNSYGKDYDNNGKDPAKVEDLDSDGDGADNLTEIMALTFPGDANDVPVPTPEPTATPEPAPDLTLSKQTADDMATPGQPVTFTLEVENIGDETAVHVVVTDTLPAGLLSPSWDYSASLAGIMVQAGAPYVWKLPELAPGASGIITVYAQLDPSLPADFALVNMATISTSVEESNPYNNRGAVIIGGERGYLPMVLRLDEGVAIRLQP